MKRECQICGKHIPNRIIINGVVKILSSRKRCLHCSPYGKQGKKTGILGEQSKTMSNYKNWKEEWKEEHRNKILQRGIDRKKEIVRIAGGECLKCGYIGVNRTMSFHHRNPSTKKFGLSGTELSSRKWKEILEEVNKCDLLCVRCHAEIEDNINKDV